MPEVMLPFIPTWKNVKLFALGGAWWVLMAVGGAFGLEWYEGQVYSEMDWQHVRHIATASAGASALAYTRKYRALISEPPEES